MMPPKEMFAHVMDEFGISPETEVVLYGTQGCFSIPRVLYTFKAMGHPPERVWMMNGSLKDWIDAGGPVEKGYKETMTVDSCLFQKIGGAGAGARAKYDKAVDARNVVGMDKILELVQGGEAAAGAGGIIVDARSAGRFVGKEPEPRKGLRGGHMPGAFNVPFDTLLNEEKNKLRSREEMISIFENAGVDVNTEKDIICSCGSGVTACWIAFALEECGRDPTKTFLYDGSWIEWASDESNPVVKEE
jgi:thiosulfate/3-mercaptopyruvate sulfurtransferase